MEREEEAEQWARQKLGLTYAPNFFRAISSVNSDNDFVCVIILTNFSMRNVDISIAIGKGFTHNCAKAMFNKVFRFLFTEMCFKRITGLTGAHNHKARKAIDSFGFKLEGVMRKALPQDEDLMVYGLLYTDYQQHRWFKREE